MDKKLYKSQTDKMLAGVCGGIAEYLNVDSTVIRLLWLLVILLGGSGIILYILAWAIIPSNQKESVQTVEKVETIETSDDFNNEAKTEPRNESSKNMGIILLIVGLIILFTQIAPIYIPWTKIWPVLIIALGLYLIINNKN